MEGRGVMTAKLSIDAPHLEGWLTLTEAAKRIGISRQAMDRRAHRGKLATLCKIGCALVLAEDEVAALAAEYAGRNATPSLGLSKRQAETLLNMLLSRRADYSFFVTTGRALIKRGLIENPTGRVWQLTDLGKKMAITLQERQDTTS